MRFGAKYLGNTSTALANRLICLYNSGIFPVSFGSRGSLEESLHYDKAIREDEEYKAL